MILFSRAVVLVACIAFLSTCAFGSEVTRNVQGTTNYFDLFLRDVPALLSRNSDLFVDTGLNLYRSISAILIIWFAAELVFGGGNASRFLPLLWMIALVGTMLVFYVHPIPGIGRSFRQLFTDQAQDMSQMISNGHVQAVMERLAEYEFTNASVPSSPFDVSGAIRYWFFMALIALAQGATIAIIAYGFLAAAVAGLIGPCFIPFFLVPGMEWMAWGWLKAFIQYAFYPVIANAYTFVMMQGLLNFCPECGLQQPNEIGTQLLPLLILLIAYVYGMLKLPSLVSSLFSGRSGESAFWRL